MRRDDYLDFRVNQVETGEVGGPERREGVARRRLDVAVAEQFTDRRQGLAEGRSAGRKLVSYMLVRPGHEKQMGNAEAEA